MRQRPCLDVLSCPVLRCREPGFNRIGELARIDVGDVAAPRPAGCQGADVGEAAGAVAVHQHQVAGGGVRHHGVQVAVAVQVVDRQGGRIEIQFTSVGSDRMPGALDGERWELVRGDCVAAMRAQTVEQVPTNVGLGST